jgi:hypothetical protein
LSKYFVVKSYRINKLFLALEEAKSLLLSKTAIFTDQLQMVKPSEKEWSMVQVLLHLIIAEELSLGYVRHKLSRHAELKNAGLKSWLRYQVVVLFLRFKKKIKAPAQIAVIPDDVTPAETLQRWQVLRSEWKRTLETMPEELLDKEIFRHPVTGFMNISQTLRFLREHILHHVAQIERISHHLHNMK